MNSLRSCFIIGVAALGCATTRAQTAPTPASTNPVDPEVLQLTPFVVSTELDRGYAAMNTTSATRISMPIKELPVNISVVTRQFLDDSLAFNFMDTLEYSSGIITRRDDRTAIIVRGFQSGESFVNNFRRIDQQDSSNIERVEIIRGPAAVLYGISSPGGTVNVITKKPVYDRTFGEFKATTGSHSLRRAEVDLNAPIGEKVAFRFNGAHQHSDGYYAAQNITRDFDVDEINVITPSLALRPFAGTNITLEVERMHLDKSSPEEILTQSINGRDTPVAEIYGYPIRTTFKGPWQLDDVKNTAITAILDQRITDAISLRLSAYSVDYHWPRGGLGNFSFAQSNGAPWLDPLTGEPSWRARWSENLFQWNRIYSYRADAVWKFDLGTTKHQVLAGWQYYEDTNASRSVQDYIPGTRTVQFYYFPLADKNPMPERPAALNLQPINSGSRNRDENSQLYAVHTGKWFNDRFVTLLGIFQIEIDNINRGSRATDNALPPEQHSYNTPTVFKNDTLAPQIGALYMPNDRFSYYALYSESVEPVETGRNDQFGDPLMPVYAQGFEAGVKLDLGAKVVGTIGLYSQEIQNSVAFNELLPNPFNPTADPNISPRGAYEQVGQRLNQGLSVDLVWSPIPNFQARAGWQHTLKNEITGDTNTAIVGRYFGRYIRDFATFYGRYQFDRTSRFAGFSVNAGLQWRDKQLRGYPSFANGQPTWQKGYWNTDLAVRYQRKVGKYQYTVAVNAKNLLKQPAVIGYRPDSLDPFYYDSDPEYYLTFGLKY
jgi:outer membrane receptor protein involved in Fe transport